MDRVESIGVRKKGVSTCAADARDHHDIMMRESKLFYALVESLMNAEITAAWAPGGEGVGPRGKCARVAYLANALGKNMTGGFHVAPLWIRSSIFWMIIEGGNGVPVTRLSRTSGRGCRWPIRLASWPS